MSSSKTIALILVAGTIGVAAGVGWTAYVMRRPDMRVAPEAVPTSGGHEGHAPAPTDTSGSPGVYISPARQQLIGVRTEAVTLRSLEGTIKATGTLAYDETRIAEIHTKIAGWVEQIHADFVGKPVARGQALFCVYSPELVSTQKEYLLALKAREQLAKSQFAETREGADSLLAAARERLKLWDISDEQIAELERSGEARKTLTLYSPFSGVIVERATFDGHYLMPEAAAFRIADLSTIWAVGEVFEYELPRIHVGQTAVVEFSNARPARSVTGRIAFIAPDIDPQTRRAKVRVELTNPGGDVRPGGFVTVAIKTASPPALAVPSEAVIDSGDGQYVILAHGNGSFEPRAIKLGQQLDGYVAVLDGLAHGDVVVTSAQFLIDSETNLRAAMKAMGSHGHSH